MKHVVASVLLLLAFPIVAEDEVQKIKFDPVFSADQTEIAFESLTTEFSEFQSLSQVYELQGQITELEGERDIARSQHDRYKQMYEKRTISKFDYQDAYYRWQMAESDLARMQGMADKTLLSAELDKLILWQRGVPGSDYRRQIAEILKQIVEMDVRVLQSTRKSAVIKRNFQAMRWENSQPLCDKGVITKLACAKMRNDMNRSETQLKLIEMRAKVLDDSLDGMNRAIRRLFNEP